MNKFSTLIKLILIIGLATTALAWKPDRKLSIKPEHSVPAGQACMYPEECMPGLECNSLICTIPASQQGNSRPMFAPDHSVPVNGSCTYNEECMPALVCVLGKCKMDGKKKTIQVNHVLRAENSVPAGESCMYNSECMPGFQCTNLVCVDNGEPSHPVPVIAGPRVVTEGFDCLYNYQCVEGLVCKNMKCAKGAAPTPAPYDTVPTYNYNNDLVYPTETHVPLTYDNHEHTAPLTYETHEVSAPLTYKTDSKVQDTYTIYTDAPAPTVATTEPKQHELIYNHVIAGGYCLQTVECITGLICENLQCVDKNAQTDAPAVVENKSLNLHAPCKHDSECLTGLVCRGDICSNPSRRLLL